MNKQQRRVLINFGIVTLVTIIAAYGMIELRNRVSYSESRRAMEQLSQMVMEYKQKNGTFPPESYIIQNKGKLEGSVRMGNLIYRSRWLDYDSPGDAILAYVRKDYKSLLFHPGAVVLQVDGKVVWVNEKSFDKKLKSQQSPLEIEMTPTLKP